MSPLSADGRVARAVAAFEGVAVGDALGHPADHHRAAREPWLRGAVWSGTVELDAQRVSRPLMPFALTLDTGALTGTDDTEALVVAARSLLVSARDSADGLSGALSADAVFDAWLAEFDPLDWAGPAERIAALGAARGLRSPVTGRDNPARGDDSAVVAGVAAGALFAGAPRDAARAAEAYASIAHADDGVWATGAFAAAISLLLDGESIEAAVGTASATLPEDSWTAATLAELEPVVRTGGTGFEALPEMLAVVGPRDYSHPSLAARTVPAAFALVRLTAGRFEEALPLALSVSRLSDSLPSLIGALCGASGSALPARWDAVWRGGSLGDLGTAAGVLQPRTRGASLGGLARELLTLGGRG
ncbi:MAG: ADP-ribosylglycohydrolase family protein [Naasia sp.]